jgi:hypothetical protein
MTPTAEFRDCYTRASNMAREMLSSLEETREGVERSHLAALEAPARSHVQALVQHMRLSGHARLTEPQNKALQGIVREAERARIAAEVENIRIWGNARAAAVAQARMLAPSYQARIAAQLADSKHFSGPVEEVAPKLLEALERPAPTGIVGRMRDTSAAEAHAIARNAPRHFKQDLDQYCEMVATIRDPYGISPERLTQICMEEGLPMPRSEQFAADTAAVGAFMSMVDAQVDRQYLREMLPEDGQTSGMLRQAAVARAARKAIHALLDADSQRASALLHSSEYAAKLAQAWPIEVDSDLDVNGFLDSFELHRTSVSRSIEACWALAAHASEVDVLNSIALPEISRNLTSQEIAIQFFSKVAEKDHKAAYVIGAASSGEAGLRMMVERECGAESRHAFHEGRAAWLENFAGMRNDAYERPPQKSFGMH